MADLVTHLCVVLLPGSLVRPRLVPVAAFGTALPDLLGRGVPLGLERLIAWGAPLPEVVLWPWSGLHEPLGWALACTLFACAFVERDRAAVLGATLCGGALHTAIDVLQGHHGEGYLLLAPFSERQLELGLIGSEATVPYAWPLALLTAVAWVGRRWRAVPIAANVAGLLVAAVGWSSG